MEGQNRHKPRDIRTNEERLRAEIERVRNVLQKADGYFKKDMEKYLERLEKQRKGFRKKK